MRLLLISAFIGRYGETDGVVTTYSNLLHRFKDTDIEVDCIAYAPEDDIEVDGNVRLILHRPRLSLKIDPIRWIDGIAPWLPSLMERLRDRYDLVQSSSPDSLGLLAHRVAKRDSIPLLGVYHTALDQYLQIRTTAKAGEALGKIAGDMLRVWLNWYYSQCDLVLTPSHAVAEEIGVWLEKPIDVWRRGVDTDKFSPAHRTRTNGKVRAIYVGRVAPEKGLADLVPIFRDRDDVELQVVGDGPYLDEIRDLLPNATIPGKLVGDDLQRAYADADFFVFPSRTDTLGNVVLEGMASGLPAIVTDTMGPKELITEGVDGFIISDMTDFAERVDRLVANAERRKLMSEAARASSLTKSWQSVFEAMLEFQQRVLRDFDNKETPVDSAASAV